MAKTRPETQGDGRGKRRWIVPVIFLPFIAVLWVPFFNTLDPALWGIPFFYWYQLAWIVIGAALTIIVYLLVG
jgi:hypothetical protein